MSYQALARKWRPKQFSEVIGQEHVVSALTHALQSQKIHHGFLFTGTRGVGKTTLARIFSKAMNCESGISVEPCGKCTACLSIDEGSFIDLIEVDAASRTKVDDTRELLENVQYSPSMGRFKIYLIDEVHMLSTHSFNALLKTLEEPPEHVKFLLATTDPQKLPATILSRCIQFNLKSMNTRQLTDQLEMILKQEEIAYEQLALKLLSRSGEGSVRDSLSLLDQAIAYSNGNVTQDSVREMLGMIDDNIILDLLSGILENDAETALNIISRLTERAADYSTALDDLLLLIHNVALYQAVPEAARWKDIDVDGIAPLAKHSDPETLQLLYQIGVSGKRDLEFAPDSHSGLEMVVLRMLAFLPEPKVPPKNPGKAPVGRAQPNNSRTSESPPAASTEPDVPKSSQSNTPQDAKTPSQEPQESAKSQEQPGSEEQESESNTAQIKWSELDCAELLDQSKWETLIKDLQVDGVQREMLKHMVPKSVNGNVLEMQISSGTAYFSEDRMKRVEDICRSKLNLKIRFKVVKDDQKNKKDNRESLAAREQRMSQEQTECTQEEFLKDPVVQELVSVFDGKVKENSIKTYSKH